MSYRRSRCSIDGLPIRSYSPRGSQYRGYEPIYNRYVSRRPIYVRGAQPDYSYNELIRASRDGDVMTLKKLVDSGVRVTPEAVEMATREDQEGALQFLLRNGGNPSDGLRVARQEGNNRLVRYLLEQGANPLLIAGE